MHEANDTVSLVRYEITYAIFPSMIARRVRHAANACFAG